MLNRKVEFRTVYTTMIPFLEMYTQRRWRVVILKYSLSDEIMNYLYIYLLINILIFPQ